MKLVTTSEEFNFRFPGEVPDGTFRAPAQIAETSPIAAAARHQAVRRDEFPSDWQSERQQTLHPGFEGIEAGIAQGGRVGDLLRRMARRLKGRTYRTKPGKKMALSFNSLSRCFYFWRAHGRTAEALRLHYKPGTGKRLAPEFGILLAGLALETDCVSMAAAIRAVEKAGLAPVPAPHPWTFQRNIPEGTRRALKGLFRQRYDLLRAERRVRKMIMGGTR